MGYVGQCGQGCIGVVMFGQYLVKCCWVDFVGMDKVQYCNFVIFGDVGGVVGLKGKWFCYYYCVLFYLQGCDGMGLVKNGLVVVKELCGG